VKQKIALGVVALLVAAAIGLFTLGPGIVERQQNKMDSGALPVISERAKTLHRTLTIVDLHADTLMWDRNLLARGKRGHVDLPRLREGNVALQVFSSVTKSPRGLNYDSNSADAIDMITPLAIAQGQPSQTWSSLLQRSLFHADKLHDAVDRSDGRLVAVASPSQLDTLLASRPRPVGAMLSVEGLHDLEGNLDNLDKLYQAGFRMASLTHFFDNDLAGSMHGTEKGGLTDKGRAAVRRMEALGMIVDVAHCSHRCVADILAMARRPLVSSHGGVQATCNVNRNLTDEEIRGVARTGGVIGIGYWDGAVCSTDPAAVAKAIKYVRDLVGIEYVALGSDYDGATTVRFDASQLVQVTQALLDAGFTDDEIRAVMGGNALRVLRAGLLPSPSGEGPGVGHAAAPTTPTPTPPLKGRG